MSITVEIVSHHPRCRDMLPAPPRISLPPQPLVFFLSLPLDLPPFQSSSLSKISLPLPLLPLNLRTLLFRSLTGDVSVSLLAPSELFRLLPLLGLTTKTLCLPAQLLLGKKCCNPSLNTLLILLFLPLFLYGPLVSSNAIPPCHLCETLLLFLLTAHLAILLQTDALPPFIREKLLLELLLAAIVFVAGLAGGFLPCLFSPVG